MSNPMYCQLSIAYVKESHQVKELQPKKQKHCTEERQPTTYVKKNDMRIHN
jgi:hypothetical protein